MVRQRFTLDRYGWKCTVYYAVRDGDVGEVLEAMHAIGCDGGMLRAAYENIAGGEKNTGVTYSNFAARETVMVIAAASSPMEFAKSWRHEAGHMAMHIAQAYGIDPYGEQVQYIGDEIVGATWEYAAPRLCSCRCCRSKAARTER